MLGFYPAERWIPAKRCQISTVRYRICYRGSGSQTRGARSEIRWDPHNLTPDCLSRDCVKMYLLQTTRKRAWICHCRWSPEWQVAFCSNTSHSHCGRSSSVYVSIVCSVCSMIFYFFSVYRSVATAVKKFMSLFDFLSLCLHNYLPMHFSWNFGK